MTGKEHEGNFWNDGNSLYLDEVGGDTDIYSSGCTIKICASYPMCYTSFKKKKKGKRILA